MAWPVRHRMVGLLFGSSLVNYIDRVNISIAAPAIMLSTGLEKDQFGLVFSAFVLGYALFQVPGGLLADRWSGLKVLTLAFCGFSLFTALTPLGQFYFSAFLVLRFLVGAFEALTYPAVTSINSKWIPTPEFGRAQTLSVSGSSIGQMLAFPLTTWIILQYSWEMVFYVNAAMGFAWVILWTLLASDSPRSHRDISKEELEYIESHTSVKDKETLPLKLVFTSGPILMLAVGLMCYAYILWTFWFWFPTYLVEARGLSLSAVGFLGIVVHAFGFLGTVGGGAISDRLLKAGKTPKQARTRFAGLCVFTASVFLVLAVGTPINELSVVLFFVFYLMMQGAMVGFMATPVEFSKDYAGSIFGIINSLGATAGIFGPMVTGFLVSDGENWAMAFGFAGLMGLICAIFLWLVPVRPLTIRATTTEEKLQP